MNKKQWLFMLFIIVVGGVHTAIVIFGKEWIQPFNPYSAYLMGNGITVLLGILLLSGYALKNTKEKESEALQSKSGGG